MSGNAQEMIATHTINTKKKNLTNAQSQETVNNVFLSLQMAMESTMLHNGSNNFKLQHISKEKLRREGRLPVSISCKPDAVSQARNVLGR